MHNCIEENPDVIILTERRNNKQTEYDALNLSYNQYVIEGVPSVKNTVCILTKQEAIIEYTYKHNVITVIYVWLSIYWVYFPQKNEKKEVFEFIDWKVANTKSVVMWDFNTGKHLLDEQWETFYCQKEFIELSENKMVDIRRKKNPVKKEFSRYSSAWNWFRIDHALVSPDLDKKISEVWYDHSIRKKWLSDHSMMYISIE